MELDKTISPKWTGLVRPRHYTMIYIQKNYHGFVKTLDFSVDFKLNTRSRTTLHTFDASAHSSLLTNKQMTFRSII